MRRTVGIGGIKKKKEAAERFRTAGREIEQTQIEHIRSSLSIFKSNLEAFAVKHKKDIRSNAVFRAQFSKMCQKIGVDPLASTKGFWAELLGVGDFYYELSIQIIEVCLATRVQNGGLLAITDLFTRLSSRRGPSAQLISLDDVRRAIDKVKVLGGGFGIVHINNSPMILSVPIEFNKDHTDVLEIAQQNQGHISISGLCSALSWPAVRSEKVIELMMENGIAWVDQCDLKQFEYWFPSLIVQ
uniref:Vacuolar-sorting protein SNF8 n=1 Tax=Spongospora subterranea TaxID=70186 RepID=A0A0H5RMK8_9EUKA|eukprot:CRZ09954.1 hypothetical protein [Spongospora subterranea]